jgi:hypothetical protein
VTEEIKIPMDLEVHVPGPSARECIDIINACTEALKAVESEIIHRDDESEVDQGEETVCRKALLRCIAHTAKRLAVASAIISIRRSEAAAE